MRRNTRAQVPTYTQLVAIMYSSQYAGHAIFRGTTTYGANIKEWVTPFHNMLYTIPYQLAGPSKHVQVGAAIGHNIRKILHT